MRIRLPVRKALLIALLLAFSLWGLSNLRFSSSLEPSSYLSPKELQQFRHTLEEDRDYFVLIVSGSHSPLKLKSRLIAITPIQNVLSGADFPHAGNQFFQPSLKESLYLLSIPVSPNASITQSRHINQQLKQAIEPIESELGLHFTLAGRTLVREAVHDQLPSEMLIPVLPIIFLVLAVPWFFYRHWLFVAVPAGVGVSVILVSFALYGLFGHHFDYFTLTLIPLLLTLSLLDCVFLLDRYSALTEEPWYKVNCSEESCYS